jgi:hypothetical protein
MSSSSLTISRTHYFRLVTGTVTMLSYVHRHIPTYVKLAEMWSCPDVAPPDLEARGILAARATGYFT